ncbi:MAG: MlaD family protein, partial [Actinomycetota bacterium]
MTTSPVRRGGTRARSALLGVIALLLFVAAAGATYFTLLGGFRSGLPVQAVFSSAGVGQQLPIGGDVKVRGVLVGTISGIALADDGSVEVDLLLNDDGERLPGELEAEIGSKTLFGEKWVELIPLGPTGARVVAGSVIEDHRTTEPLELEQELELGSDLLSAIPLRDLTTLLNSLAEGFGGREKDAAEAIDRGLVALRAVNSRSSELDLGLRQLNEFSAWLDDNDDDLLTFMDAVDQANRALVGAAPEFRASMDSVPTFLEDLASFQEATEEDFGRLIRDGATIVEVLAIRRQSLADLIVNFEAFLTVFNSGLSQPCAGEYESNMTCWQLYLLPGLESRGLYGPGEAPNEDETGDPGRGSINRAAPSRSEVTKDMTRLA